MKPSTSKTAISKTLRELQLRSVKDVKQYMIWLNAVGLGYHYDDDPKEVLWHRSGVSLADEKNLRRLHGQLWRLTDPWELIESDAMLAAAHGMDDDY